MSDAFFDAAGIFFDDDGGTVERLVQITRLTKNSFCERITELSGIVEASAVEPQIPVRFLSKYYSERQITPDTEPIPDCVTCGACCMFAGIVPTLPGEASKLDAVWEIVLDDAEDVAVGRVIPRDPESGYCVNLQSAPGEGVGCTVYSDRPFVCRDFDAGSDRCHAYRRMLGIEPPLSDAELETVESKIMSRPNSDRISDVHIELGSTKVSFDLKAPEGEQYKEKRTVQIFARMYDETIEELHSFDPAEEAWFENELEGMTLDEARAIIEQRKAGQ
ncbi:MAG: YkgJ family cysteine cluster protein [Pyrinomonadaceae bacterium]